MFQDGRFSLTPALSRGERGLPVAERVWSSPPELADGLTQNRATGFAVRKSPEWSILSFKDDVFKKMSPVVDFFGVAGDGWTIGPRFSFAGWDAGMPGDTLLGEEERQRLIGRYAEIAALAGGLAHEIKNPLSTISLNLELLLEDLADSDAPRDRRMHKKIVAVQRECKHLEEILEDFLQFARLGELHLVESDLNAVVQEFMEFYQPEATKQQVDISPHLATDLPLVSLDPALFRQVLMNLALNAQQAMPKGGLLELQTYVRDGKVYLDLIDNGKGMTEQVLAKMYQPFFSTRVGGNGLGLPTVKKIVEAHGGRITCDSAPSRGTRFTIMLPAVPDSPGRATALPLSTVSNNTSNSTTPTNDAPAPPASVPK